MADRPYVNQLNFSAPEPPPARLAWTVKDELRVKKLGPRKPDPKATGMHVHRAASEEQRETAEPMPSGSSGHGPGDGHTFVAEARL